MIEGICSLVTRDFLFAGDHRWERRGFWNEGSEEIGGKKVLYLVDGKKFLFVGEGED